MKCFLESLGCPKNLVDSELMLSLLLKEGYSLAISPQEADIIIVNTCGFIERAREEAIDTILEMALMKEEGRCKFLIAAGCLAQKYVKELTEELPEVDAFIGTGEFHRITEVIKKLSSSKEPLNFVSSPYVPLELGIERTISTPFYYSYLKIAEGCDHKCSFCVIPELRGKFRSRLPEDIIKEAEYLGEEGVKEINIIAQDTTRYGKDLEGDCNLAKLLEELEKVDTIKWLRILYFYPSGNLDDLLSLMSKSEKICNYIDIPLQHCEKKVLKNMSRRGDKESLLKLISHIREKVPGVTIRTSLIVGFPGETEEDFESLLDFAEKAEFDRLGAFVYSKEEGTKAGEMKNQISREVKEERLHRIMTLQKEISLKKNQSLKGSTEEVIIEGLFDDGPYSAVGRTKRDAPDIDGVIYITDTEAEPGDIIKVRIVDGNEYDLIGEEIQA